MKISIPWIVMGRVTGSVRSALRVPVIVADAYSHFVRRLQPKGRLLDGRSIACLVACSATVAAGGSVCMAQQVIPDRIMCTECTIAVVPTVHVGDVDGPGALPDQPMSFVVDSKGRFWSVHTSIGALVFDPSGRFLTQVGRIGQGPREFRWPRLALAVGDSVVVYDQARRTLNVIGPDFSWIRSVELPGLRAIHDVAVLRWPTAVIINADINTPDNVGWPTHVIDVSAATATVRRSFGENNGVLVPMSRTDLERGLLLDPATALQRRLAASSSGDIWSLARFEYALRKWSADGRQVAHYRREAAWFPELENVRQWSSGHANKAPHPTTLAVRIVDDNQLWVFGHVPAADWRQAYQRVRQVPRRAGIGDAPASSRPGSHDLYHSIIEVVDPVRRHVITRRVIEGHVIAVLGDGRIAVYREGSDGRPEVEILRTDFRGEGR